MQHQLSVTEVNALWIACGTGRIERGRHAVLVKVREVELVIGFCNQGFIVTDGINRGCLRGIVVGQLDPGPDRFDVVFHALDDRQEVVVHQHNVVFGVVHRVNNLFWGQSNIDRMQNGTNHRNGKETLQVSGRIPVHHRNRITRFNTGIRQGVCQTMDSFNQVGIGVFASV